jgi:hypothetical protein
MLTLLLAATLGQYRACQHAAYTRRLPMGTAMPRPPTITAMLHPRRTSRLSRSTISTARNSLATSSGPPSTPPRGCKPTRRS